MTRTKLFMALAVAVALVAAVVALSAARTSQRADAPQVPAIDSTTQGSGKAGGTVAAFTTEDIDGRAVRITRGKPGALFFFAGWCGSCIAEAAALADLQRELGSKVAITAISPDPTDSVEAIRRFRKQVGTPRYPFVWDATGKLATQFAVQALDTTIVYDADGKVVFRDSTPTDVDALRAAFSQAGVQ